MIAVEQWSPADSLSLEPNALTAAKEIDRNLALTAGPGAGKTEMLAQRADFLLRTGMCRYPKRILAISFKVDASQNLKARVRKRCGPELAARFDSHTFHAFAKRIIDQFRLVLTGQDALDPDYAVGPHRVQRRSITFNDMVPLAVEIVESSQIARNAIRQTYSHVFLDEFQDCIDVQYQLIKACFQGTGARLTAVGDTKQRIMGWAGALEGIFETYAEDFEAHSLNLYQNFRSAPRLRRMQNAMVRVMDPPAALDDDDLTGDAGEIGVLRFENDDDEANALADAVRGWIDDEDVDPSEIAVLVSKQQNLYGQKLRAALDARGVPFRDEDEVQNLASEPVANLIVDFLLVAAGQRQPAPYRRLLDLVVFGRGLDPEREYQGRSRWDRFVAGVRQRIAIGETDLADLDDLQTIVNELARYRRARCRSRALARLRAGRLLATADRGDDWPCARIAIRWWGRGCGPCLLFGGPRRAHHVDPQEQRPGVRYRSGVGRREADLLGRRGSRALRILRRHLSCQASLGPDGL